MSKENTAGPKIVEFTYEKVLFLHDKIHFRPKKKICVRTRSYVEVLFIPFFFNKIAKKKRKSKKDGHNVATINYANMKWLSCPSQ